MALCPPLPGRNRNWWRSPGVSWTFIIIHYNIFSEFNDQFIMDICIWNHQCLFPFHIGTVYLAVFDRDWYRGCSPSVSINPFLWSIQKTLLGEGGGRGFFFRRGGGDFTIRWRGGSKFLPIIRGGGSPIFCQSLEVGGGSSYKASHHLSWWGYHWPKQSKKEVHRQYLKSCILNIG